MAALILPSRRVVQPQGPVEIDWANPLTSALALDARGDQYFRDAAAGRIPSQSVGSFTRVATSYGFAANLASAVTSFGDVELSPTNAQASFQIIEIPDNLTQVAGLLNKRTSATSQNSFSIGYNYVGTEFNVDLGNSAGTNISLSYRFNRSTFSTSGNNLVVIVDGAGVAGQRIRAYRNGVLLSATASIDGATATFANTTSPLEIGRVNNGTLYYAGKIVLVRSWNRVLEVAEVRAVSENPWQLYRPQQRRIWVPVAGGATNYSLTADVGAYTLTGIDATLTYTPASVNYSLTADVGSYSLVGVDALLKFGRVLPADAGSYSLTGIDAALAYVPGGGAYTLTADTGAYSLSGNDAGLTFARSMTADVGSYTFNGLDAVLLVGRRLTADTGAYSLAGVDADLVYTALGPTAYALTAETGSYTLTGNAAGLTYTDGGVVIDTHDGFWAREWKRMRDREKRRDKIEERIEAIGEEIAEVEEQIAEVRQAAQVIKFTPTPDFYTEQTRIVKKLIARRDELIEQEDEELLLLL